MHYVYCINIFIKNNLIVSHYKENICAQESSWMDTACLIVDFVLCGDPEADVRYSVTFFCAGASWIKTSGVAYYQCKTTKADRLTYAGFKTKMEETLGAEAQTLFRFLNFV